VVAIGDGFALEDRSKNGLRVNGRKVRGRSPIAVGDVVELGGVQLRIVDGPWAVQPDADRDVDRGPDHDSDRDLDAPSSLSPLRGERVGVRGQDLARGGSHRFPLLAAAGLLLATAALALAL
jgi:hypothetical protein